MATCQEDGLKKRELDPCSPAYSFLRKQEALNCLKRGQQREAAFNFSEALAASFRTNATLRYDTVVKNEEQNLFEKMFMQLDLDDIVCNNDIDTMFLKFAKDEQKILREKSLASNESVPLNKKHIKHNCTDEEGIQIMMNQIRKLPKEWNVIQITKGEYNENKFTNTVENAFKEMSTLYITVYNCETMRNLNIEDPVTVTVTPTDEEAGALLFQQYHTFLSSFKESYNSGLAHDTGPRRLEYWKKMEEDNSDLKKYVDELESLVGGWKALLQGNLLKKQNIVQEYQKEIDNIIESHKLIPPGKITNHHKFLLYRLSEICGSLSLVDIKHVLKHILPGESLRLLRNSMSKAMKYSEVFKKGDIKNCERGPVILIIDEMLDRFPWEMMSIFQARAVSRGVSLNVIYALYEKHYKNIKDGYFIVKNTNGRYILNPDDNLDKMEKRMLSFLKYWLPHWTGVVGLEANQNNFQKLLEEASIFLYCGHGNGCQHIDTSKIEKLSLKSVVFLSGCSSVATAKPGRKIEGTGIHMNYHIACSPCVIGNLWIVTDKDSDRLMTKILSTWLPSFDPTLKHFKDINLEKWQSHFVIDTKTKGKKLKGTKYLSGYNDLAHEPDLLKAISCSRGAVINYKNACAMVARGIPVKYMK